MGLDTFAEQKWTENGDSVDEAFLSVEQQKRETDFAGCNSLVGGMFSGSGPSFRGKVYDSLIERITGESLYQERINNVVVCRMAILLRHAAQTEDVTDEGDDVWNVSQDLPALAEWFTIAADNGYDVVGWW